MGSSSSNKCLTTSAACMSIGVACVVAVTILFVIYPDYGDPGLLLPQPQYGIVVDAGTSRTSMAIYTWPVGSAGSPVQLVWQCPLTSPALSTYSDNPTAASEALKPCLDLLNGTIPANNISQTPIFLGATAGLRFLRSVNATKAEAIMTTVRTTIASYNFFVVDETKQIRILEGGEEGAYAWITVNYLLGNFKNATGPIDSSQMSGSLDLGAGSTQIAFEPADISSVSSTNAKNVLVFGQSYKVYSKSHDCYGVQQAWKSYLASLIKANNYSKMITDPCSRPNTNFTLSSSDIFTVQCQLNPTDKLQNRAFTFFGSGDSMQCQQYTISLFYEAAPQFCANPPCSLSNELYQPPVRGNFTAFSAFYYVMHDVGLSVPHFTLAQLFQAWDSYCTTSDPLPANDRHYCFQLYYISNLLFVGYQFDYFSWKSISFVQTIGNNAIDWRLGMLINSSNLITPTSATTLAGPLIPLNLFIGLEVAGCALVALSLFLIAAACVRNKK